MRISDWSSDVCSSDLSEADDQSLRKLWHSNHSLEEIAEAMGRTTPSLYSRARALGMSKRSPANAEKAVASAPAGRSEEHTSELQSLMRISYAVFCLKKKKKKETA